MHKTLRLSSNPYCETQKISFFVAFTHNKTPLIFEGCFVMVAKPRLRARLCEHSEAERSNSSQRTQCTYGERVISFTESIEKKRSDFRRLFNELSARTLFIAIRARSCFIHIAVFHEQLLRRNIHYTLIRIFIITQACTPYRKPRYVLRLYPYSCANGPRTTS